MAWMNQAKKATIASMVKPILAKYGMKGTLSVRNHSTIVLTLTSGKVDFIGDMVDSFPNYGNTITVDKIALRSRYHLKVNNYHLDTTYTGTALKLLKELDAAMHGADWYDRSDIMTDYFDTAYYIDINVGKWDKPYDLTK